MFCYEHIFQKNTPQFIVKHIKTINIFIEDTALTPGMELQIGNIFALMKYTYPSDKYFYDKLYSAPLLNSESFADSAPRPTTETQKAIPAASPKTKEKKETKKPGKGRKIACQQSFMALGQAKVSLLLACLRKIILLIPLIFILPHLLPDPVFGVFLAEPVSDILAATITTITFFSRFNGILERGAAKV